ncbi:hypothetical protein HNQ60_002992 [Povalibacter uvarum]|uniref:Uncharacterized protein n=1 Tax=Povalibacter uvarum TaxID=732238 RepID=A0A841HLL6_9GAMM|nr:hypothetical protein [Povalibacter uvarum]MBB6094111.1 hypothetical protein [Povalibacter uvarum]
MTTNEENRMEKSAWQSQPLDAPVVSLAFVHHQASRLNKDFRQQKGLMYWALGIMVAAGLVTVFRDPPSDIGPMLYVMRVGILLALAGAVCVVLEMRSRARMLQSRDDVTVTQSLDAYRSELERRRDYYLHSWRWSLLPMLPAALVLIVGGMIYDPHPEMLSHYGLIVVFAVAFTAAGVWDHRRKGHAYQGELDALGTLEHRPRP